MSSFLISGQIYPPLGQTVDSSNAVLAMRTFMPPLDLSALGLAAVQTFLGLNASTGSSSPDDANAIIASQVFGA